MRILKTACGNAHEAFIESRLTYGVNIIFSNDNSKGKTIIFQGMMYALGNDPIFPAGFDYRSYYFYTSFEHEGLVYEFLRKSDTVSVKIGTEVRYFEDISELKRFVDQRVFPLPRIIKDKLPKLVDLPLFYQLFFIGQDKRDPANVFNSGYYNKNDFMSMLFALTNCLALEDTTAKLSELRRELASCKAQIETLDKRIAFYKSHPEIATKVSRSADRKKYEQARQELISINESISALERKRSRLTNRIIKLRTLLTELNSLNQQLKCSEIRCLDCGGSNISFVSGDFTFELTNDIVRKNIIQSIKENIQGYSDSLDEIQRELSNLQAELHQKVVSSPVPVTDILLYSDELRSCAEEESKLYSLYVHKESLEEQILQIEQQQSADAKKQAEVKESLLSSMNHFYKVVDPSGQQCFRDVFAKKNVTFSGCDEQEYYFSRTLAIFLATPAFIPDNHGLLQEGRIVYKEENAMIGEYQKTKTQVILSATLKDEEYTSGRKYYDIPGVNAIDYECHQDSHILQPQYIAEFSSIINSFGLSFA